MRGSAVGAGTKQNRPARYGWRYMHSGIIAGVALLSMTFAIPVARADYTDGLIASRKISMEAGVRLWRKAAWRNDDFLSEIRLGDLYANERADNKFHDPIEAYVWYYLATHSDGAFAHAGDWHARRIISQDYHRAMRLQNRLMLLLDAEQRADARKRIIYILSCRGADGYIKLGQIFSSRYGHDADGDDDRERRNGGDPTFQGLGGVWRSESEFRHGVRDHIADDSRDARRMMGITWNSVLVPNDGEALTFFHIADEMGHPLAREYIKTLNRQIQRAHGLGTRIARDAEERSRYWTPPYEFYPPGNSASGVPYTDECYLNTERQLAMGLAVKEVPTQAIQQSLWFLGWIGHPGKRPVGPGEAKAIGHYQASIGAETTDRLTAAEGVRLIQTAALRGDASSQNTLGVMYAKGIGVRRSFVRAEYWFQKAGDQRYAAALYHLSVLYKVGPEGIKQDLSKSNDYVTASALAGFRPTMNQLDELLEKTAVAKPRPGQH